MRGMPGSIVLACLVAAAPLEAQAAPPGRGGAWRLGLTVGTSTFNGAAVTTDESGANLVFRPYRPTMFGLHLTRGRERTRLGLSVKYGQPGLGFRGQPDAADGNATGVLIVAEDAFNLASVSASVGTRIATLRGGPSLRSSLGISIEHWSAPGTPSRTLLGPLAGLALEFALSGSLFAHLDGELGFTPGSPFHVEDLPEGFRLRSTWRRTLQAGLSLRL